MIHVKGLNEARADGGICQANLCTLCAATVCSIFLSFAISKGYWAIKSNYAPLGNNLYLEAFEEGKIPQLHLVKWLHVKEMTS